MNVVRITNKQDTARAFKLVVVLRRMAEAVDHQDELSVIELHGAMLAAADTYGTAEWDRLWGVAGFAGPSDAAVVQIVKSMLADLIHREAS
jgi:hypothetical protein